MQEWNKEFIKNTTFLDPNSLQVVIEIGVFVGWSTNYICDKLLTPNGIVIGIDPLESEYEYDSPPGLFNGQYEKFIENTKENSSKINLVRKKSIDYLPLIAENSVDLTLIDGHHEYNTVKFEAKESYRICKVGGYIVFDDYLWGESQQFPIKRAVDEFLSEATDYKLLLRVNQVIIQKLPQGSGIQDGQSEYQQKSCEKLFNESTIHTAYINLKVRPERDEKLQEELRRVGIKAERFEAYPWKDLWDNATEEQKHKWGYMHNIRKTPGAIGVWESGIKIMKDALAQNKHAIIFEDDIQFCNDFPARLKIIYEFLNQREWDTFFFGGTYHKDTTWHKSIEGRHTHHELRQCKCNLNRDWEPTNSPYINRVFGAFSTHAYMVNKERIPHIINMMERDMHFSMGVDWWYILRSPELNCFAFDPGCIKQYSSQSNIGNGWSNQDFSGLGAHWFQPTMNYK